MWSSASDSEYRVGQSRFSPPLVLWQLLQLFCSWGSLRRCADDSYWMGSTSMEQSFNISIASQNKAADYIYVMGIER